MSPNAQKRAFETRAERDLQRLAFHWALIGRGKVVERLRAFSREATAAYTAANLVDRDTALRIAALRDAADKIILVEERRRSFRIVRTLSDSTNIVI